jgi:hypothetical protein
MEDHILACQILKESHEVPPQVYKRASFLKINDINDISFIRTSDCYDSYSIAAQSQYSVASAVKF